MCATRKAARCPFRCRIHRFIWSDYLMYALRPSSRHVPTIVHPSSRASQPLWYGGARPRVPEYTHTHSGTYIAVGLREGINATGESNRFVGFDSHLRSKKAMRTGMECIPVHSWHTHLQVPHFTSLLCILILKRSRYTHTYRFSHSFAH